MRQLTLPLGGKCRCSATRFELTASPLLTFACHCGDCRRLSASAFSLTAIVPAAHFRITEGAPVARPLPGSPRHHHFCPDCMTLMYTRIEGADERVNIRPTLLSDPSWSRPFVEIMTRDKLPWSATGARHSYQGFPLPAELDDLYAGFEAWFGPRLKP